LGIVLLGLHTGQHFAGGEADIVDFDAGLFFKLVEIVDDFAFGEGGVNGEFLAAGGFGGLLGLCAVIGFGFLGLAAAGGESKQAVRASRLAAASTAANRRLVDFFINRFSFSSIIYFHSALRKRKHGFAGTLDSSSLREASCGPTHSTSCPDFYPGPQSISM